ncbi:MAG: hypothetical protein IJR08_04630 [Bacilli bacterium]|nr:hypothetical protein [Bacilli bacterium]
MVATIIISGITFLGITLSILLFPHIKIKNITIDTYWLIAILGAVILVATTLCPIQEIGASWTSSTAVNPLKILILFFSMTVLSIYLDELGLFRFLASLAVNKAKGHQNVLFFILYFLVAILTIFTSNDIVILTFTPFICFFCKHAKIKALPYLIAEFAAANTWSMMFIIGNPTNIYLATSAGINFIGYLKVMLVPTIIAGLAELLIIFLIFRKSLKEPLSEEEKEIVHIDSKLDLIIGSVHLLVCLVFLVISPYIGIEMWLVAAICAASLLLSSFIIRLITKKNWIYLGDCFKRLPYQLIPFILSMSVIVIAINYQGIASRIGDFLNQGPVILTYGVSSYLLSNVINNIPMSILFSNVPTALSSGEYLRAIFASIIGSNIGAFLTPIGALAGIMFSNLLSKYEMKFTFLDFIKYGSIISVPVLAISLLSLFLFI